MSKAIDYAEYHEKLCRVLGLETEVTQKDLRLRFLEYVRGKIKTAAIDIEDRQSEKKDVEELCQNYFDYNSAVVKKMAQGLSASGDHQEAANVKTQAGAIIRRVHRALKNFVCCEMDLYATMRQLDQEIEKAREEADENHRDIQWSYNLPEQVALACRRRDVLSEFMVKMRRAKFMIEKLDPVYNVLEGELDSLLGEKQAKQTLDEFNGQLRQMRFSKAEVAIKSACQKDKNALFRPKKKEREKRWKLVLEIADVIVQLVRKVAKNLKGRENKIFLRSWELRLAYEDMERQLKATREFIAKYQLPEIQYRRDALDREKERLYAVGNFESILTLSEDLQKGCAFPMPSLKDVRGFESGLYNRAQVEISKNASAVEQIAAKTAELAIAPNPEAVPDDKLFDEHALEEEMLMAS